MLLPNWSVALNQFAILFDDRVPMGGLGLNSLTQTAQNSLVWGLTGDDRLRRVLPAAINTQVNAAIQE